jgi:hypothetical protein
VVFNITVSTLAWFSKSVNHWVQEGAIAAGHAVIMQCFILYSIIYLDYENGYLHLNRVRVIHEK